MLRIGLADDHILFRESLKLLVNSFEGMEVLIEAANGKELLAQIEKVPVDIILLDLQMPEMDGFETCQHVNELYPQTKVLILTFNDDQTSVQKCIEMGAEGYYTKKTKPAELKKAILKLQENGFYFEKSLLPVIKEISTAETKHYKTDEDFFTIRELDVLQLTAQELSSTEIANQLHISPRTVEKHKKNMQSKIDAKNFIGVIKYALINGHLKLK